MVERNKDCPFPSHAGMWNCKKTKKKKKKKNKIKKKKEKKRREKKIKLLWNLIS